MYRVGKMGESERGSEWRLIDRETWRRSPKPVARFFFWSLLSLFLFFIIIFP